MTSDNDVDFNYILNDMALLSLVTKCLYSESASDRDKRTLYNQIERIIEENSKLRQWDCNKDTRNSRQRVANKNQAKAIKRLRSRIIYLEDYLESILRVLVKGEFLDKAILQDEIIEILKEKISK